LPFYGSEEHGFPRFPRIRYKAITIPSMARMTATTTAPAMRLRVVVRCFLFAA